MGHATQGRRTAGMARAAVVAALASVPIGATPQRLPSVEDPPGAEATPGVVSVPIHLDAAARAPDPERLRARAAELAGRVDALTGEIANLQARIPEVAKKALQLEAQVDQLVREKALALWELQQGLYCSECKRPKSQIERETGQSFETHLKEVHGRALPATQEMLDAKAKEYGDKIAALQQQLSAAKKEKAQLEAKDESERTELRDAVAGWKAATDSEYQAYEARQAAVRERAERELARARQQLAMLERERARLVAAQPPDPAARKVVEDAWSRWNARRQEIARAASEEWRALGKDASQASAQQDAEYQQISHAMERLADGSTFAFIPVSAPTFSVRLKDVGKVLPPDIAKELPDVSMAMRPGHFEVGVAGEGGTGTRYEIDAGNGTLRSQTTYELGKNSVTQGYETHWGPNGIRQGPYGNLHVDALGQTIDEPWQSFTGGGGPSKPIPPDFDSGGDDGDAAPGPVPPP